MMTMIKDDLNCTALLWEQQTERERERERERECVCACVRTYVRPNHHHLWQTAVAQKLKKKRLIHPSIHPSIVVGLPFYDY